MSDEAHDALDNLSAELRRKSANAWKERSRIITELAQQGSHEAANEIIESTIFPEEMPGEIDDANTVQKKVEREEKINKKAANQNSIPSSSTDAETTNNEEANNKIKLVDYTNNNVLWEMYYDASVGTCVKINKHHRFSQLVYNKFSENKQLALILDSFFFTLTVAEKYTIKSLTDINDDIVSMVLETFRDVSSNYLIKTAQSIDKIV